MNEFVKVRTGGKYLDILRDEKLDSDIFVGNPDNGKPEYIKIYRGGVTKTIHAKEFDEPTMQIEYTYTKHEIIEEAGVWRLKTEAELLEDAKAKVKLQLGNIVSQDIDYIMTKDTTKYDKVYASIEKAKTIGELKNILI